MISRQQRRAEERRRAKEQRSFSVKQIGDMPGGMTADEAIGMMTGTGGGREIIALDQVPEDIRAEFQKMAREMEAAGMGPVSFVKKPNGEFSIITAPTFERIA